MGGVAADWWRRHKEVAASGYALSAISRIALIAVGGAAYLVSKAIKSARVVAFADLGMEAIYEFEVKRDAQTYNGGMRIDITQPNFQGVQPAALVHQLRIQCKGCDRHPGVEEDDETLDSLGVDESTARQRITAMLESVLSDAARAAGLMG